MKKKIVLGTLATCLVASLFVYAGCSSPSTSTNTNEGTEAAEEETTLNDNTTPIASTEWQEQYSYIFDSMEAGMDVIDTDGRTHSMFNMGDMTDAAMADLWDTEGLSYCMSCRHGYEFAQFVEDNGDAAWGMSYGDVIDYMGGNDSFACYDCHGNNPGVDSVGTYSPLWETLAKDMLDTYSAAEQACGQCHTGVYNYISNGASIDWDNADAYRYGVDPLSIRKAYVEDGGTIATDEETGIELFYVGYNEVEMFQGSGHDQSGMTCISCHSREITDEDGNTFMDHNFSGSPLENETTLEYCLTCHTSMSGIETTDDMVTLVKDKQAEIDDLDAQLTEKMATLYDLVKTCQDDSSVDQDVVQQARDNYADAYTYQSAVWGYGATAGTKVAHNPSQCLEYMSTAIDLVDESIAALS